jgi:hypothetical protein
VIVSIAAHILEGDSPGEVKLATLELLAKRGYGSIARLAATRLGEQQSHGGDAGAGASQHQTERTDAFSDQAPTHEGDHAHEPTDAVVDTDEHAGVLGGYQW